MTQLDAPRHSTLRWSVACLLTTVLATVLAPIALLAQEPSTTLRWSERVTAQGDAGRWLEIQPNGIVHLHVPSFLHGAGDFELRLDEEELDGLIKSLVEDLANFDAKAVETQKRAARAQDSESHSESHSESFSVSGAALTALDLTFDPKLAGDLSATAPRRLSIRWRGIAWDARHHPENSQLAALERAQQSLIALFDHSRALRLSEDDQ